MQIAIEIRHEFGDVAVFANFAAKLQSLFAEFAVPTVRSAAPAIANANGPGAVPPRAMPERTAAEPTVAVERELTESEVDQAFNRQTNSDTVTEAPSLPGSAYAEAPASVPVSDIPQDKPKRGRKPNAAKANETPSAASLPLGGGPAASVPPPATAHSAPVAVPQPAATGAAKNVSTWRRAFILKWIGRWGDAAYMDVFNTRLTDTVRRFGDLDEVGQIEVIAELRAVHPLTDAEVDA